MVHNMPFKMSQDSYTHFASVESSGETVCIYKHVHLNMLNIVLNIELTISTKHLRNWPISYKSAMFIIKIYSTTKETHQSLFRAIMEIRIKK